MTTTDTEPIGPLLDAERKAGGVKLYELADALGCSEAHVSYMLRGVKRMRTDQLDTILRVLRPEFDLARALDLIEDDNKGGRRR